MTSALCLVPLLSSCHTFPGEGVPPQPKLDEQPNEVPPSLLHPPLSFQERLLHAVRPQREEHSPPREPGAQPAELRPRFVEENVEETNSVGGQD
mmetsp:Transcript_41054/g.102074  ORF Transcript_41054/g.102074 Transcript_41054/m.102074 type:complete len:94 (-) Transcript_41054:61-342(-)